MFVVVPEVRRAVIGDTSVPFALARSDLHMTKRTKKSGYRTHMEYGMLYAGGEFSTCQARCMTGQAEL